MRDESEDNIRADQVTRKSAADPGVAEAEFCDEQDDKPGPEHHGPLRPGAALHEAASDLLYDVVALDGLPMNHGRGTVTV